MHAFLTLLIKKKLAYQGKFFILFAFAIENVAGLFRFGHAFCISQHHPLAVTIHFQLLHEIRPGWLRFCLKRQQYM
jgi:hypothetical protein